MNRLLFISFLFAGFCIASCVSENSDGKLPLPIGKTGEALIVINDNLWKNACGDSIRKYLTEPVWGLPAPEPTFTLSQISRLSKFMQKKRNMLIINVDPGLENASLKFKTNVYAKNQLIFNLDAPSADSVISCMSRNRDKITAYILTKDRDAIIDDYRKIVSKPVTEKLREKFQVDIVIPRTYIMYDEKSDFVWMKREEDERYWGILMWEEPYLRTSQLETDSLIFKMNAMTRKNVPGPSVGSYMADEPIVTPLVKRFEKNGIYSVQLNGLWQTENSYMGGPYVKQTIVDAKRGRLVTALGFVFYPNREKREMVRQLEAILYSITPAE